MGFMEKYTIESKFDHHLGFFWRCVEKETGENFVCLHLKTSELGENIVQLYKLSFKSMKRFNHPNIVKVVEIFEDKENFFVVMEDLQETDLVDQIIQQGSVKEEEASTIVMGLLDALEELHSHKIIVTNITTATLVVGRKDGLTKIFDFTCTIEDGFDIDAKFMGNNISGDSRRQAESITPELLDGQDYTELCDCWCMGVVAYTMLLGFPPFQDDHYLKTLQRIMELEYDFDEKNYGENLSKEAKDFISKTICVVDDRLDVQGCMRHPWIQR